MITYKLISDSKMKLKKEIRQHAEGSLYRMNCKSADCYAFSYDKIGQKYLDGTTCKKIDFSGGWDWKNNLVDIDAEYILDFTDNKFYQVI